MAQPTAQQAEQGPGSSRADARSNDAAPAARPWQLAAARSRAAAGALDWLAGPRAAALARLDENGLPDRSQEDWRHTDLSGYVQRWSTYLAATDQPAAPASVATGHDLPVATHSPGTVAVQVVDGVLVAPAGGIPRGLSITSLHQLTPKLRARAAELLLKAEGAAPESLVDLNSALMTDAILIATDAGSNLDGTTVHVHLQGSGAPVLSQPRLLVDIARDSRLTVIVEHSGMNGMLANAVTQAWVGDGAHLSLIRVQSLPDDGMLTETSRIELAAAASAHVTSVDLGGLLSRQAVSVLLDGAGATATIDGLFLADDRRHIDNCTRLEHAAPGTTSREFFRGLADGHGHGIFNGKIIVRPGAAGSNAALTNRNLLLAATAEIDTKPELEIYVDDVRCSHGATTGQLDANALFYLRSRGLDPAAARQVLTAAFLREALGKIGVPALRARLEAHLEARLGGNAAITGPGANP